MNSDDLMYGLLRIEHVVSVELHWSPALEVRVLLDRMDWDARAAAIELIDDYAREHVKRLTVTARFDAPEPVDFTRHAAPTS